MGSGAAARLPFPARSRPRMAAARSSRAGDRLLRNGGDSGERPARAGPAVGLRSDLAVCHPDERGSRPTTPPGDPADLRPVPANRDGVHPDRSRSRPERPGRRPRSAGRGPPDRRTAADRAMGIARSVQDRRYFCESARIRAMSASIGGGRRPGPGPTRSRRTTRNRSDRRASAVIRPAMSRRGPIERHDSHRRARSSSARRRADGGLGLGAGPLGFVAGPLRPHSRPRFRPGPPVGLLAARTSAARARLSSSSARLIAV